MSFLDNLTAQLPFGKKSENTEYFFVLNIGLSEVSAAVWAIFGSSLDILGQATLPYKDSEDLLEKAYRVLDQSLGALEVEPEQILFGVPDSWGIDDNLKEPYLKLLRRMLKEYDLKPLAYVTTTNAIANLLQKQEGIPPTAILLGVGDFIEVTLIRGGKVVETRSTTRSDHLFEDIEKILSQFTEIEVLPSKILLYPIKVGENLVKIHDELMSYPWMQKLPFLHFPKIDILEEDTSLRAVTFAGAIELSPEIDLKQSFPKAHSLAKTSKLSSMKVLAEETAEDQDHSAREFGFVAGDIKEQTHQKVSSEAEEVESEPIKEQLPSSEKRTLSRLVRPPLSSDDITDRVEHEQTDLPAVVPPAWLNKLGTSFLKKDLRKLGRMGGSLTKLAIIPLAIGAALAAYFFLARATVTIFIEPQVLERETEVIADPVATVVDEEKKIIPGKLVETTVSGSGKATATGTKKIGDPAKGKVVLYNLTNSKVSFSQGTVLASNSLKFTLDSSIQVASQSSSVGADLTTVIKPGKSEPVSTTADTIGPEGNLAAGTDLIVAGYSKTSVVARVEEALSGGTSKDVTVVTSDDQKKLQAQVLGELRQKAEEQLKGKLDSDKKIISEALAVIDGKYNFNKAVNDQAKEFSLSATVRFKGTSYSEADLKTIVSKLVGTTIPEGFQLNLQESETQADVAKVEKDGKLIFKAKFRAKLQPKLDIEGLKKELRGQSLNEVSSKLKTVENVMGSEIKITPSLPSTFARLPLWDKNIEIIVTPK